MGRPRSVLKAPGMLGAKFKKQVTIVEGDNVSIAASAAGRLESKVSDESSDDSDEESDSDDSFDSAEGESMSDDSSDSAESSMSNVSKFKSKVRDSITSRGSLGKMFQR